MAGGGRQRPPSCSSNPHVKGLGHGGHSQPQLWRVHQSAIGRFSDGAYLGSTATRSTATMLYAVLLQEEEARHGYCDEDETEGLPARGSGGDSPDGRH